MQFRLLRIPTRQLACAARVPGSYQAPYLTEFARSVPQDPPHGHGDGRSGNLRRNGARPGYIEQDRGVVGSIDAIRGMRNTSRLPQHRIIAHELGQFRQPPFEPPRDRVEPETADVQRGEPLDPAVTSFDVCQFVCDDRAPLRVAPGQVIGGQQHRRPESDGSGQARGDSDVSSRASAGRGPNPCISCRARRPWQRPRANLPRACEGARESRQQHESHAHRSSTGIATEASKSVVQPSFRSADF